MKTQTHILSSGLFLLAFIVAAASAGPFVAAAAASKTGTLKAEGVLRGTWPASFEKNFNESLPVFETSRALWGQAEYALFGQGRKGVVVGTDGWLFTDEEFSCASGAEKNMAANLAYVEKTKADLEARGAKLLVALIPAKARVYGGETGNVVPAPCHAQAYDAALKFFTEKGLPAVNVLAAMKERLAGQQGGYSLFLRTDTHWSPEGAQTAAKTIAAAIPDGVALTHKTFATALGAPKEHDGDLMRYVPGVEDAVLRPDELTAATTQAKDSEGGGDLFGDDTPEAVLVGTSYSANPLWNFEGFLKDALQADVLNMADEGLGPFTVMDRYLADPALKNSPPKLVIWEIPERYLLMPHEIGAGSGDHKKAVF